MFFPRHSKSNSTITKTQFCRLPNQVVWKIGLREYEILKTPYDYVYGHRLRLNCYVAFVFVFADRCDS